MTIKFSTNPLFLRSLIYKPKALSVVAGGTTDLVKKKSGRSRRKVQ